MISLDKQEIIAKNMAFNNTCLSQYATKDEDYIRFHPMKEDMRPPFFHDIDRIIYSSAYTRYMDKTQVFSYSDNDHISKRMVHVQFVSKIARTIGRALGLNEDLIEAASLGHDLGHTPFGHVGESVLNELSLEYHEGYFNHNIQSVRMLMDVLDGGDGKNLTLQVLDAIMCHNGEFLAKDYKPVKKTKEQFLKEYQNTYHDESSIKKLTPMTLEGCVVRISDMIAYLGRDIDDAILLGVFKREDLPKEIVDVLGAQNRNIVSTIIEDVIEHSILTDKISMSDKIYQAMKSLKNFNMENIYIKANHESDLQKYQQMFRCVFEESLRELEEKNKRSYIYRDFLKNQTKKYLDNTSLARIVIDFISGMTDKYLLKVYSYYKN